MKIYKKIESRLLEKLPQGICGSKSEMEKRYRACFGTQNFTQEIEAQRKKTLNYYILICLCLILLVAAAVSQSGAARAGLDTLPRPSYEEGSKRVKTYIDAVYNGVRVRKEAMLNVRPQELTDEEKESRIDETAKRLTELILGEKQSVENVTGDLTLLDKDPQTGVEIVWNAEPAELIDDNGRLNLVRAREGESILLTAKLKIDDLSKMETIEITLGPAEGKADSERALSKDINEEINETLRRLGGEGAGESLALPAESNGVAYSWAKEEKHNYFMEITLLLAALLFIWKSRYSAIDKKVKIAREEMARDFPEFTGKLLLLLSAGLVVSSAVEKIAADYARQRKNGGKERRLYEELLRMAERIRETNASLPEEITEIAQRSGSREFSRFASILADNIDKGSALADKLQAEKDILWNNRKKNAEERGRIAETKLTIPLALLLLSLIIIMMAPGMLTM